MKTILITGANRGIGLALALEMAHRGWNVFAGSRRPMESPASNIEPVTLDVLDDNSVAVAAEKLSSEIGRLDVLVNNAAVFPGEGGECLEDAELSWFSEAFETNVTGVARVTRAFLPLLRKAENARIVNISSGAGSIADKEDYDYYPYSVSKAALNMLTRAKAAEFRPEGIGVFAISPGWVRTDMGGANAPLTPGESASALASTIESLTLEKSGQFLGRDGSPDDYRW